MLAQSHGLTFEKRIAKGGLSSDEVTGTEYIEVKRTSIPTYPRVAIREFVANLCVHQDFAITGMPITIAVFDNRLVMTNPGTCLNDVNRLIDLPPHLRNEAMAQLMLP